MANAGNTPCWTMKRMALCLGVALVLVFPQVIFGRQAWFVWDHGVLSYPFVYLHKLVFWRGELPLWNPYSNCGAPFLAQWGPAVLYPFSLIYLLLPLPWSLDVFELCHLLLAGLGMYWLARQWVGNGFPAAFAGFAYAFQGMMLSSLVWPNYTIALGWLPWVLGWARRSWREGGRAQVLAVLAGALQMLSGVPEILIFTWLLVLGLFVHDFLAEPANRRVRGVRLVMASVGVGGLTAVQLLPFLELLSHSQRHSGFAPEKWAMPVWGLANWLVPAVHYFQTPQEMFFQMSQIFISTYYPGIGLVLVLLVALTMVRRRLLWGLAAALALSVWLAMGQGGGLYPALKAAFPFLGVARYPVKFLYVALVVLPLLGALGWQWLETSESKRRQRVLAGGSVLLALLVTGILWCAHQWRWKYDLWTVTWQGGVIRLVLLGLMLACAWFWPVTTGRRRQLLECFVLLLLVMDVAKAVPNFLLTAVPDALEAGIVRQALELQPDPVLGQNRMFISPAAEEQLLRSSVPGAFPDFMLKRRALWSNLNVLDEVPKVNGSSTLQIREQADIQSGLYATNGTPSPGLLDFLGVAHVVNPGVPVVWTVRTTAAPWVTGGQQPVFAEQDSILTNVLAAGFDGRQTVYLPAAAEAQTHVRVAAPVKVDRIEFGLNHAEIDAQATAPAWLVIAQSYYPCWRARVDGVPVPLWPANHAFQALELPAGQHRVELRYEDGYFRFGAWLALLTLSVLVWQWRRSASLLH